MKYKSASNFFHLVITLVSIYSYGIVRAGDIITNDVPLGYTYMVQHFPRANPLVIELRDRIQGIPLNPFLTTDNQLARYLEATNYNVDAAVARLERTSRFRSAIRADDLLKWTPPDFMIKSLPIEQSGYTEDGSPVYLIPFGRWNFQNFFHHGGKASELFYYAMRFMEEANNCTIGLINPKTGWPVDQVVLLVDAKGYSIRNFLRLRATSSLLRIFRSIGRHYTFSVKKAVVVNAPVAFKALWKVARAFSSARVRTSYKVFSRLSRGARNALLHNFPINTIPLELGGTYIPFYNHEEAVPGWDNLEYFQYSEHIEPVKHVQPVEPPRPVQPKQPVQVIQPLYTVQPLPLQPIQPIHTVDSLQHLHNIQSFQAIQPLDLVHVVAKRNTTTSVTETTTAVSTKLTTSTKAPKV